MYLEYIKLHGSEEETEGPVLQLIPHVLTRVNKRMSYGLTCLCLAYAHLRAVTRVKKVMFSLKLLLLLYT